MVCHYWSFCRKLPDLSPTSPLVPADIFGRKVIFLGGLVLFEIGGLLSALANSIPMLVGHSNDGALGSLCLHLFVPPFPPILRSALVL